MSKFQILFFGLLVVAIVGAVAIFSFTSRGGGGDSVTVRIWGTYDDSLFNGFVSKLRQETQSDISIDYTQKNEDTFETDLVEAIASGRGPDAVFLPQDLLLKQHDKILPIPYRSYSERTFKDTFIEEGELYLDRNGIMAVPFSVDPLILFWNRDLFSSAGVARPPALWDELYALIGSFTKKDNASNILQTAIALGEYGNVTHAKDIMSLLLIQAGNPIVTRGETAYESMLDDSLGYTVRPADAAINFYTQFADPLRTVYLWNRSLPQSKDFFIAGDAAMYIGYASEILEIRRKNPNLNFDIAPILQARGAKSKTTFAMMDGIAILKSSRNVNAALNAITFLTAKPAIKMWSQATFLPPVRRDILAEKPSDSVNTVLYDSALWSHGWLDPNRVRTAAIFKNIIDTVTSGRSQISEAIHRAEQEMNDLLKPLNDAARAQ